MRTNRHLDTKSGSDRWSENQICRLDLRNHRLHLSFVRHDKSDVNTMSVCGSVFDSGSWEVSVLQRFEKVAMQRCQMIVSIGIVDTVDMKEGTCPESD
jgi:hypothetical protein